VIKKRHAEKAQEAGVDGLILVCAGAGGHAGVNNPMPFIRETREFFKGTILLAGAMSSGQDVASALQMGADLAYMGTRFINTEESKATDEYRDMIIHAGCSDIVYTAAISGVSANFLGNSLQAAGITEEQMKAKGKVDFGKEMDTEAKAWKTIWSAGQGSATIKDSIATTDLINRMKAEFKTAIEKQVEHLKKYSELK
jgi:nitronate monooxygenase